jgi:hypothetical protein
LRFAPDSSWAHRDERFLRTKRSGEFQPGSRRAAEASFGHNDTFCSPAFH